MLKKRAFKGYFYNLDYAYVRVNHFDISLPWQMKYFENKLLLLRTVHIYH